MRGWDLMQERNKGIFFIILAAFCFSLMNVFVRLSGDLPTMQKVLFRNLIAAGIAWIMLIRNRTSLRVNVSQLKDLVLRSVNGYAAVIAYFYAIDRLTVADATILNELSPFFAILMSVLILKEKATRKDLITVMVAFIGAMFVVKPGFSVNSFPGLIGLLGGLGAGIAYTYVRSASKKGVSGPYIVMFFSTFSLLCSIPWFILYSRPMRMIQLMWLLAAGLAAAGGQLSVTAAYSYAPAKEISVYDFLQVLFAAILGFFLFDQIPDRYSFIGYGLIILAAILRTVNPQRLKNG